MRFFRVERQDTGGGEQAVLVEFTPRRPLGRPRKPAGPYRGPDCWYDQRALGAGRHGDCQGEAPAAAGKVRP